MYAKSGTVGKMARAWDDGGKEVDRTEVLEAPAASEEDSAEDRVEVSEVPEVSEKDSVEDRAEVSEAPAVLVEYSAMARAEVLDASVASEEDMVMDRVEVSEASVVSGGDSVVALVLVPAVSGGDRVLVPAFVAYRTDSTENRAAGTVLTEVLAASAVGLACAYDHRRYPA